MKTYALSIVGFLLLCKLTANPQSHISTLADTLLPQIQIGKDSVLDFIALPYHAVPKNYFPVAVEHFDADQFNKGLVSDPMLLLQGKTAGIQIYNRGGDPNTASLVRFRGLSSTVQRLPLYIVDGQPVFSLNNIDPNDIATMTLLKDGAAQAMYGIRASNGVVLLTTHSAKDSDDKLQVSYNVQAVVSTPHKLIATTSTDEYLMRGGLDFGSRTDWADHVLQNAFSHTHHLAVGGRIKQLDYRISANIRDVQGVLRQSGFDQGNVRANIGYTALKGKLQARIIASVTRRESQFGFKEAVRNMLTNNPTVPIYASEDARYYVNPEVFEGYYEQIGLADTYNPVAMINLNDRFGEARSLNAMASLSYQIVPKWGVHVRLSRENSFSNQRAYYSPNALFLGNVLSSIDSLSGRGELTDFEQTQQFVEAFTTISTSFLNRPLNFTVGASTIIGDNEHRSIRIRGFSDKGLIDHYTIADANSGIITSQIIDNTYSKWSSDFAAYYGMANLHLSPRLWMHASLRYEGSDKLGADQQWGTFPALGLGYDLVPLFPSFSRLSIRGGVGITGAIPDEAALSKRKTIFHVTFPTDYVDPDGGYLQVIRDENPDLKWEEKKEWNIGIDAEKGRWSAFVEAYTRQVTGLYTRQSGEQFYDPYTYVNANAIRTLGLEAGLDISLLEQQHTTYQTGIRLSTFKTTYTELNAELIMLQDGCCGSVNPWVLAYKGGTVGHLMGPVFNGVGPVGEALFVDINGDGIVVSQFDNLPPGVSDADLALLGQGTPKLELGWWHSLQHKGWSVNALIRGAFGHSLVNRYRQFYEGIGLGNGNNPYNYVQTELAVNNLRSRTFTSLFIEKASFVKLDYISISKAIKTGFPEFELSVGLQNVLLASRYTGTDPEPALEDAGDVLYSGYATDRAPSPVIQGIDRRNQYIPARQFVLGVAARF